ncbi:MAG: polysaccharide deacetylase family protein [Verrucomicrobiae bacterium]|nr:polysaccharide deacetylase family protein [Verrucomicrobiae bacterium]
MNGTLLLGYDVEHLPGRVPGLKWAGITLPPDTTEIFFRSAIEMHKSLDAPATIFILGCKIRENIPWLEKCLASGLFEIAHHTFSHYPLKTIVEESPEKVYLPGLPFHKIENEIAKPIGLLKKHLGIKCRGMTAPYLYYRGFADRPDILQLVKDAGLCYTRSYGRNSNDYCPLDWSIQPFWYQRQGFPGILELPAQGWMDAQWRRAHGWEQWDRYLAHLKKQARFAARHGLCWSHVQHDWTSIYADPKLQHTRKFLIHARQCGLKLMTHNAYYNQLIPSPPRRIRVNLRNQ